MKGKYQKKLDRLIQQRNTSTRNNETRVNIDTTKVINKSKINLTKTQLEVLAMGFKFVQTPKSTQ
ncbi:unnamed protein product, partial [Rotaria sp. Silwood1]